MAIEPAYEELSIKNKELEQEIAQTIEANEDLVKQLQLFRTMVENASDLIHTVAPDGSFIYVNRAWRDALGYSAEDLASIKLLDIVDENCRSKCRKTFKSLIAGTAIDKNETTFVSKSGKKILVEGSCRTRFEGDQPVVMTGIFRDISNRVKIEHDLLESEERYRSLFDNATDIIQLVRPDGRLLYVNRSWVKTFGYNQEDIDNGISIFDLISPDCQEHCQTTFQKVVSSPNVQFIDTSFVTKDGTLVIIEGNACCKFENDEPVMTQCIFRDVTEKRKMQAELFTSKKLESVGILAGGIAHDFNNLLTAILGNISLAKATISPQETLFSNLEKAEKACSQAANLTKQLLTFSMGGTPIKKPTNITELIKESTSFILRGANVKCEFQIPEDLWATEVDDGQLNQVNQNLVINACQAMPDGGTMTIMAANKVLSKHDLPPLPAGKYVHLSYQDHGIGISKENLLKIFDPYFTSKEEGSGLGLAISYSIIKNHGGLIAVDSEQGKGTTFSIYLPATDKSGISQKAVDERIKTIAIKVLLMDDEDMVREVATALLQHLGCEVVGARDGEEAIDLFLKAKAEGAPFDVVMFDITIPGGMGGKEAIIQIRAITPDIKAIVSSGYASDPIMANYKEYGFKGVVAKPYKIEELSKILCELVQ